MLRPYARNILHCTLYAILFIPAIGLSQTPIPLNDLFIKGTHNSYACTICGHNDCPVMYNHPVEQYEDFGVWAFELDFSIVEHNGNELVAVVGHNGEGRDSWSHVEWGPDLEDYLRRLRDTEAFLYRPLIVYIEKKTNWGIDLYDSPAYWIPFVENTLTSIFNTDQIYTHEEWVNAHREWPDVTYLKTHAIICAIGISSEDIDGYGNHNLLFSAADLPRGGGPDCYDANDVLVWKISGNYGTIGMDLYQYDWTFQHFAAPLPLIVDRRSLNTSWVVRNDEDPYFDSCPFCICWGGYYSCDDGCSYGEFTVHEQGTSRFPYRTLNGALNRLLSDPGQHAGWTIVLEEGHYPESTVISFPVRIVAKNGNVLIGE